VGLGIKIQQVLVGCTKCRPASSTNTTAHHTLDRKEIAVLYASRSARKHRTEWLHHIQHVLHGNSILRDEENSTLNNIFRDYSKFIHNAPASINTAREGPSLLGNLRINKCKER
jgi:hypothetical protein